MSDRAQYWVEIAEYDLETARALLTTQRYLYVGFMCHQVVEKMLKACYAQEHAVVPPKIHNLRKLAVQAGVYGAMSDEQKDFLDTLEPLNIESRYPAFAWSADGSPSAEACTGLLSGTEELFRWIEQRLLST